MGKTDLKVVKGDKPKAPTKAEIKKEQKAEAQREKERAAHQAKEMEKSIAAMFKGVSESICNSCLHCINPNKTFDRFKVKSSQGDELFAPMNFCGMAGISVVDVIECEKYSKRDFTNQD